jgi:hypothetical protein
VALAEGLRSAHANLVHVDMSLGVRRSFSRYGRHRCRKCHRVGLRGNKVTNCTRYNYNIKRTTYMPADVTIFDLGSLPGNNARISTTKCGPHSPISGPSWEKSRTCVSTGLCRRYFLAGVQTGSSSRIPIAPNRKYRQRRCSSRLWNDRVLAFSVSLCQKLLC